jgi:acyl-CoA synthetase (AMP-forming)/AMP-acid ligase II
MTTPPAITFGPDFVPSSEQPSSLAQYIADLATSNPDGHFLDIDQFGRQRISTYGELFERAQGFAGALNDAKSSDRPIVLLCCEHAMDYVVGAWASLFAGVDVMPCDTLGRLTDPQRFSAKLARLTYAVGDAVLITDEAVFQTLNRCNMTESLKPINIAADGVSLGDGLWRSAPEAPVTRKSRLLIQTSGTTADPKIAILEAPSLINRFFDGLHQTESVQLHNMAHYTVAGVRLLLPIGKQTVRLHPLRLTVRPQDWLEAIGRYAITDIGLSSSTAAALLQAIKSGSGACRLESLERISFGAEPIVPSIVGSFLAALEACGAEDIQISMVYSMTETGPLFRSILPMSHALSLLEVERRCLPLEHCVAGWRLRCVDGNGALVREGELGSIQVSSDEKMFSGYLEGPSPFVCDAMGRRWFDTGDVGSLDAGRLRLKGRNKSTIIVNARKIACEEIEAVLVSCSSLAQTTIVAAPYRTGDMATDEVAIFFVPQTETNESILETERTIVREVSKQFGLRARHVVQITADDVDRTTTMKVKRHALVRRYMEGKL